MPIFYRQTLNKACNFRILNLLSLLNRCTYWISVQSGIYKVPYQNLDFISSSELPNYVDWLYDSTTQVTSFLLNRWTYGEFLEKNWEWLRKNPLLSWKQEMQNETNHSVYGNWWKNWPQICLRKRRKLWWYHKWWSRRGLE